jgi:RNA polymerase sigma-70 factor (ECF subfamily)
VTSARKKLSPAAEEWLRHRMQESELVERLRRGDGDAFDRVYERSRARLFGFLARLSGDPALAEDLLQETFLRLARHAPELSADTRLDAWLFRVARNLFISHRRWAMLDAARVAELELWRAIAPEAPSPFGLAAGNETQRRLELALAALPLAQREVLLLVAVDGMSPTDAAEVLGVPAATVRQRLLRARGMLRGEIEHDE